MKVLAIILMAGAVSAYGQTGGEVASGNAGMSRQKYVLKIERTHYEG